MCFVVYARLVSYMCYVFDVLLCGVFVLFGVLVVCVACGTFGAFALFVVCVFFVMCFL